MQRSIKRVPLSDRRAKFIVTLTGDPVDTSLGDMDKAFKQVFLLRQLSDQPELLNCGTSRFEKAKIFFSGNAWVIEMEAEIEEFGGINGANTGRSA